MLGAAAVARVQAAAGACRSWPHIGTRRSLSVPVTLGAGARAFMLERGCWFVMNWSAAGAAAARPPAEATPSSCRAAARLAVTTSETAAQTFATASCAEAGRLVPA